MKDVPPVHYVRSGDVNIAYQVVGDGPIDIVWLDRWSMPLEARWLQPPIADLLRRLTTFGRVISFDKRGVGLSDPVPVDVLAMLKAWVEDVVTVMDEVASSSAALVGINDGGKTAMMFAATHPDRTKALVLMNTSARILRAPDYPYGLDPEREMGRLDRLVARWGESRQVEGIDLGEDLVQWVSIFRRLQASPATARLLFEAFSRMDVRAVLAAIRTPTLVCYGREGLLPREIHDYLAARIMGARLAELPGKSFMWWPEGGPFIDEVETFVTGVRPAPSSDRVLATILFTDMVRSTERTAELGDARWSALLDDHDRVVDAELSRHRGRRIKSTGDGILATFDGPARGIRCAQAIGVAMRGAGIDIRAGVHTGEVEVRGDDIAGLGVVIAQRVQGLAGAGQILASRTVTDLVVGSGIQFNDYGEHELKGVPGRWQLYAVMS